MPKKVDHELYRDELLSRSFDLFASRGYSNITMREIAKELGVSTGTLYHYFPTKNAMLEEMCRMESRRTVGMAVTYIGRSDDIEERMRIFLDFIEERELYFQNFLLLTIDYSRHLKEEENRRFMKEFSGYIRREMSTNIGFDETLCAMIMIFLNGLVYHRFAYPGAVSFRDQMVLFREVLLAYWKEKGTTSVAKKLIRKSKTLNNGTK